MTKKPVPTPSDDATRTTAPVAALSTASLADAAVFEHAESAGGAGGRSVELHQGTGRDGLDPHSLVAGAERRGQCGERDTHSRERREPESEWNHALGSAARGFSRSGAGL